MNVFGWSLNGRLEIGDLEISHYAIYCLLALALAAAAYLLTRRLERSWIGLLMDIDPPRRDRGRLLRRRHRALEDAGLHAGAISSPASPARSTR